MADAQPPAEQVTAEAKRLTDMTHQAFYEAWIAHVQDGGVNEVRAAAFSSPDVAGRTLLAADRAGRELKTALPRRDGESKREYQARMSAFREQLQAARVPVVAAIEDLAVDEAEFLAQLDNEAFTEEWLAFVQQAAGASVRAGHNYVQGLAFRSPQVAARTQTLAVRMMRATSRFLPQTEGESRKAYEARVSQLQSRLEAELRFLQYTLNYMTARWGRMPTAPNYRLQAMNLLAEKYPEEFSQLRNAVRENAAEAREEVRRQKRQARRAQARPAS
ncbi:hypothetical protein GTY65_24070 [Streptomyces sp. SID8379]|uniref:hypothetical protein n=1 Tax=unclassified Streptomyces TaxID=2593676 RepID=UPI000368353A|nr:MULTISPECIES: hypothetical protein [unclassified Streptomyces]MYW67120.1 hypothetical protein [Streptomyces sp. SID8379]